MHFFTDYEYLSIIDSRSFGNCFKVLHKNTNKIYQMHSIDGKELHKDDFSSLLTEISMIKEMNHENIVRCCDHDINQESRTICFVMEQSVDVDGNLLRLIEKCKSINGYLEESYIWRVMYQICKVMRFLENSSKDLQQFCLCIQAENVEIDVQGNIKIGWVLKDKGKTHACDKSNKRNLGYLIYQLSSRNLNCNGKQLSMGNLLNGANYSKDLIDMLEMLLDGEQVTTFNMILRDPILTRNINFKNEYPKIVPIFKVKDQMNFSPHPNLSSTIMSNYSISNTESMSTSALRHELFGCGKSAKSTKCRTSSEPDLTMIENSMNHILDKNGDISDLNVMTKNIFDEMLEGRLHAIRAHEFLLNQKEISLKLKENQLNEREKRLTLLEKSLQLQMEAKKENVLVQRNEIERKLKRMSKRYPKPKLDDTYCSIEPNETVIVPTIAKLIMPPRPPMKAYTGRSPKKFTKYSIEKSPLFRSNVRPITSKSSDGSVKSSETNQRVKSILSMFKLHKSKKEETPSSVSGAPSFTAETIIEKDPPPAIVHKWTMENKKAAFEMLAAMKSNDKCYPDTNQPHKRRQSLPRQRTRSLKI